MADRKPGLYAGADFDNITKCVHCGLCLDACPTYRALGTEQDSPRGRLFLMRGLWSGELEISADIQQPLDRCLDCRACESACPSMVPYGELLEKTRAAVFSGGHEKPGRASLIRWVMVTLMGRPAGVAAMGLFMRLLGATGLDRLAPQSLPRFSPSFKKTHRPAPGSGDPVRLFTGCITDIAETEIHTASVRVLERLDFNVQIPADQVCCGALAIHGGDHRESRRLADLNEAVFARGEGPVISNSAGCGAHLKEFYGATGKQTQDILEFLDRHRDRLEKAGWREDPVTVLYDAPCHLLHNQKVDDSVHRVLQALPGVTLVPIPDYRYCCGAAGIYNLTQPETSGKVLQAKTDAIAAGFREQQQATTLLSGNLGCLMQIRTGMKQAGIRGEAIHPVVFMASRLA